MATSMPAVQDAASNTVSWQSVYWALFALALSCATQPVGRFLGLPARARFFLRISPILCFVDLLDFLVSCAVYAWQEGRPAKEALRHALHHTLHRRKFPRRSNNAAMEPEPEGIMGPLARFVLAAIAVIQGIKLMACGGIPWSLVWCGGYLAPFCIFEMVAYAEARLNLSPAGPLFSPNENLKIQRIEGFLALFTSFLMPIAVALQVLAVGYTLGADLFYKGWRDPNSAGWGFNAMIAWASILGICLNALVLTVIFALFHLLSGVFYQERREEMINHPETGVVSVALLIFYVATVLTKGIVTLIACGWVASAALCTWTVILILVVAAGYWQPFMRNVLMHGMKSGSIGEEVGPWGATVWVAFFIWLMITAALGYAYVYHPTGTYKPPWANKFG